MSLGLEAGVAACNLVFVGAGYGLLAPWLRGQRVTGWISYGGLALLLGAGALGTLLSLLAVAGARPTIATFVAAAVAVGVGGLVASVWFRPARAAGTEPRPEPSRGADLFATACCFGIVAVGFAAVVGGFRSSPWLDDTWSAWLPKGLALQQFGLDPRLFAANHVYQPFANADYPLWWSIVPALDLSFVGRVDLRAVNAELAVLAVAFFAAVARLLWGRVRPAALWGGLLFAAVAPKLLDLLQSGGADVPNAFIWCSPWAALPGGWPRARRSASCSSSCAVRPLPGSDRRVRPSYSYSWFPSSRSSDARRGQSPRSGRRCSRRARSRCPGTSGRPYTEARFAVITAPVTASNIESTGFRRRLRS